MKTVLITGATSGIGKALAEKFATLDYNLILHGRNQEKLDNLVLTFDKSKILFTILSDLSKKNGSQKIINKLEEENITIDVAINNAGFGLYGNFEETDWKTEEDMIAVNITSLTHLSKYFFNKFKQKNSGHIINIASTAAFQPGPYMSVYFATKAFVLSFTESIAQEAKKYNIKVQAICPGAVNTGFQKLSKSTDLKIMNKKTAFSADTIADFIIKHLDLPAGRQGSKKIVLIPGYKNKLMSLLPRFIPRNIVSSVMKNILSKKA